MCDPVTLTGVALTGASYVANSVASSKASKARNAALSRENARQAGLQQEANALNVQSQNRYQNVEGQQEERGKELADYFTGQSAAPAGGDANAASAMPVSSSNITVSEDAKQRGQAKAFTDKQGTALGNMRAFGDALGDISRLQGRDASQIGQIGGFMRGSSSILPTELEAANQKGAGAQLFGDILAGAGSLTTMAGLSGAGADTIATSKEIQAGADPWRGLRTVGDKSYGRDLSLGSLFRKRKS